MKNGYPITKFAGIESPLSVDAEGLTSAILNCIKSSLFKRLVNVNFDGASVMPDYVSGAQT